MVLCRRFSSLDGKDFDPSFVRTGRDRSDVAGLQEGTLASDWRTMSDRSGGGASGQEGNRRTKVVRGRRRGEAGSRSSDGTHANDACAPCDPGMAYPTPTARLKVS